MSQDIAQQHPDAPQQPARAAPFWRTRSGLYLIGALAVGGLILGYEYRAAIFASGLLVWLPLLLCVGMHFFMHRGHGSGHDKS